MKTIIFKIHADIIEFQQTLIFEKKSILFEAKTMNKPNSSIGISNEMYRKARIQNHAKKLTSKLKQILFFRSL